MKDLRKIAPELSKMKKEQPFRAPKYYFDDFNARLDYRLMESTPEYTNKRSKIISMLKPVLGLAASFLIVVLLVKVPMKKFMSKSQGLENIAEANSSESPFNDMLEQMDESVFFGLLDEGEDEDNLSDEDLFAYVNSNFDSYEIFNYTEK